MKIKHVKVQKKRKGQRKFSHDFSEWNKIQWTSQITFFEPTRNASHFQMHIAIQVPHITFLSRHELHIRLVGV